MLRARALASRALVRWTRKRLVVTSSLVTLAFVAGACGGGDNGGTRENASTEANAGTSAEFDLRWGETPIRGLDPVKAFDYSVLRTQSLAVEGLVKLDKEGKVQPALAESIDQPDPTTYVYNLRDGVMFSNGDPLEVEDVVYSLERYRGKDSQNQADYANVRSISAQGDSAVVVKLKKPDVTWAYVPAYAGYITQKAYVEEVGAKKLGTPAALPLGTGPWKFDSFKPDSGAELSRNPYWRDGKAQARKISIRYVADASANALALRSGETDGTLTAEDIKTFSRIPGVELLGAPGADAWVISYNTIVPPFDDAHVRRAISHAINREGIVKATLGEYGAIPEAVVPPSLYGSVAPQSEVDAMYASLPKYEYDIEAAKREMAQSAYPDGFTTTVPAAAENAAGVKVAQIIAPDLAKIGITLKIKETPINEWLSILYGPREKLGLFIVGYGSPYPDPNALLSYWLDPKAAIVNGLNSANFKNDRIGKLIEEQRSEQDGAKRLELIGEILRISKEEAAYQPFAQPDRVAALSEKYVWPDFSAWASIGPWALGIKPAE